MSETRTIEGQIADAISQSRGGCAAAGTIANKVGKGIFAVRAVLDRMVRDGKLACDGDGDPHHDIFRLIFDGHVIGALPARLRDRPLPPRPRAVTLPIAAAPLPLAPAVLPAIADDDESDGEDDEGRIYEDDAVPVGMTTEQMQAAHLWRLGMGSDRWRDDPRALAEHRSNKHCLPFSERR